MSCDVSQYLPEDDHPNEMLEGIVHSNLRIVGDFQLRRRGRQARLRSREDLRLRVESDAGEELQLNAFRRGGGDLMAELYLQDLKMRALHTHDDHLNPDGYLLPNGHMHFPTYKFPLSRGNSSYAYEVDCTDDVELNEFLDIFCALLNIYKGNFQLPLPTQRRGR